MGDTGNIFVGVFLWYAAESLAQAIVVEPSDLSSGVFYIKLTAGDFVQLRKGILIK